MLFKGLVASIFIGFCLATEFKTNFTLNTGYKIPAIGLGTYLILGNELTNKVIDESLSAGYRLFDSAHVYNNEKDLGNAFKVLLPQHNLTRNDIFITTKIFPSDSYKTEADYEKLVRGSLENFQTDYIDLFLLHWPGVSGIPNDSKEVLKYRHNAWKALSKFHKAGLIRSIGVSNYVTKHLEDLKRNFDIVPALNQVEWHPKNYENDLLNYCIDNNIVLQAYSSLGSSADSSLRDDETVKEIAVELGKSPSQVLLRWATQKDIAVIPKATSKKHLDENISLDFIIPENHMTTLNNFKQKQKSYWNWDPNSVI